MTYPTTTNTGSYIRTCGYCFQVRTCRIVQLSPTIRAYYCDDCSPLTADDADALLAATHRALVADRCPECGSLNTAPWRNGTCGTGDDDHDEPCHDCGTLAAPVRLYRTHKAGVTS